MCHAPSSVAATAAAAAGAAAAGARRSTPAPDPNSPVDAAAVRLHISDGSALAVPALRRCNHGAIKIVREGKQKPELKILNEA
eukprot:SAG22_NODE_17_length_32684_cov_34.234095_9_plen_83_part_00